MINHLQWERPVPSHNKLLLGGALEITSSSIESATKHVKSAYTSHVSNVNLQPCTDQALSHAKPKTTVWEHMERAGKEKIIGDGTPL